MPSWKLGVERWTFRFVRCRSICRAAATSRERSAVQRPCLEGEVPQDATVHWSQAQEGSTSNAQHSTSNAQCQGGRRGCPVCGGGISGDVCAFDTKVGTPVPSFADRAETVA